MKIICVSAVLLTVVAGQSAGAARRSMQQVARATTVTQATTSSSLVLAPFAVPVAVPVTVVSQPTVLYSYRQYAAPIASASDLDEQASGGASPSTSTALTTDAAVALLSSRCAKCHTGEAPPGHLQLFEANGQILPKLPRRAILDMVSPDSTGRQRMPPKDLPKLTAEELSTLSEWARPPKDLAY